MGFHDFVILLQAVVWPIVVVIAILVFRREVPKLVQALSGRLSRLSAIGVTVEFATPPATETVDFLNEIKEPTAAGPPPRSGLPSLLELAKASARADYLVIDLRDGNAWLTSRLFLFAVVLPPVLGLRCFVFVGNHNQLPCYFLGLASPHSVARALERRWPWLHRAKVEAQLQPGGSPVDLYQPGMVEIFVSRFLGNSVVRRPHDQGALDKEWVHLDTIDEHARWIQGERQLLDYLGDKLRRETVVTDSTSHDQDFTSAVLRKRGDFVALTDTEGRFKRLVDRAALLEKTAAIVARV